LIFGDFFFKNAEDKILSSLKSAKNNGYVTRIALYIYDNEKQSLYRPGVAQRVP